MTEVVDLYVSDKDIIVVGDGSVTAKFVAGVERPLRESLVDEAKARGVRLVEPEGKQAKATAKKAAE